MDVSSFIWKVNNYYFRYKRFVRDFVIYGLFNFNYNLVVVSSSTTS